MLFKKVKRKDNFPYVDLELLSDITTEGESVEPFYVKDSIICNHLVYGENGVFVVLSSVHSDLKDLIEDIKFFERELRLYIPGVYIFVVLSGKSYFVDDDKLHPIADVYDAFNNAYCNSLLSKDEQKYIDYKEPLELISEIIDIHTENPKHEIVGCGNIIPVVSQRQLEDCKYILNKYLDLQNKSKDVKSYVDEDGVTYEKHYVSSYFGLKHTETWCPVADDNPNTFFLLTLFGGFIGLHKFKTGQIMQGLFYALTFGGFGIFYISDLLSIITGTYYLKQTTYTDCDDGSVTSSTRRIYIGKPTNVWKSLACTLCGIGVSYLLMTQVYFPVTQSITKEIAISMSNKINSEVNDYVNSATGDIQNKIDNADIDDFETLDDVNEFTDSLNNTNIVDDVTDNFTPGFFKFFN